MAVDRINTQSSFRAVLSANGDVAPRPAATSQGLPSLFNDGLDPAPKPGLVRTMPVPSTTQAQSLTRRVHELVGEALHAMGGLVSGLLQAARKAWARGLSLKFLRVRKKKLTASVSRHATSQRTRRNDDAENR